MLGRSILATIGSTKKIKAALKNTHKEYIPLCAHLAGKGKDNV
jgi:hypothetical protein